MGYNCDKCGRRVEMDRVISCLCGTKYCQQCLEKAIQKNKEGK